jgi:CubicO group peptidase (beta-lactamase class C family)
VADRHPIMGHLAGIRPYKSGSQDDPEVGNTKHFEKQSDAGLNFFKQDPLLSQPGTQFHYSTHGFALVGCVIEGASGSGYVDFLRQNVLLPAGMVQTQFDDRFAILPYRIRFYDKTESGVVRTADFPGLELQDSRRRLLVLSRGHGKIRSRHC